MATELRQEIYRRYHNTNRESKDVVGIQFQGKNLANQRDLDARCSIKTRDVLRQEPLDPAKPTSMIAAQQVTEREGPS